MCLNIPVNKKSQASLAGQACRYKVARNTSAVLDCSAAGNLLLMGSICAAAPCTKRAQCTSSLIQSQCRTTFDCSNQINRSKIVTDS